MLKLTHINKRSKFMKQSKKAVTFRLSENTIKEIESLAKQKQISQSDVIAVIVHTIAIGADLDQMDEYFEMASRM